VRFERWIEQGPPFPDPGKHFINVFSGTLRDTVNRADNHSLHSDVVGSNHSIMDALEWLSSGSRELERPSVEGRLKVYPDEMSRLNISSGSAQKW
jgi:hypothetical protein